MYLTLAWKRVASSVSFLFLLVLCTVAVFFAPAVGTAAVQPHAGVCDLDGSSASSRVVSYLLENGFLSCADADTLRGQVASGVLDCGVVIARGFAEKLPSGELEGALLLIQSPSSFAPALYRNHAAAAVYREYAPYIAVDALAGTGIGEDEILAAYETMQANGPAFSLEVVTADGAAVPVNVRARALTCGAVSLFLFSLLVYGSCDTLTEEFGWVAARIGLRRAMRRVVLPSLAARTLSAAAAVTAALLLSRAILPAAAFAGSLLLPTLIFSLLMPSTALLLAALLPNPSQIRLLMPFVLIASAALCPIYTDLALVFPALGVIRLALPPYWLWQITEHPIPWLCASLAALPASCAAFSLRAAAARKLAR
ncbi:MAG: hypothetical protein VB055_00345 [Oscillospiraceae bacterium]|nr:hypothetical protein [Oscillospiraceae bacterium]